MKTKLQQFEKAYLDFEKLDIGGFDAYSHTSIKDLYFLVLHELDLFNEGEENDFRNPKRVGDAKRFLVKYQ